jgi:hypothetical protein
MSPLVAPRCQLDHIAVIAPDLQVGVDWVAECLGVVPPPGGAHGEMGTHNHLLRLGGSLFLEVIAANPAAARPPHRRWFGLDDQVAVAARWRDGRRLVGMVARTDDLPACIASAPDLLGKPMRITRGARSWMFGVRHDGALPLQGAVPHVMDWGAAGPAVIAMPDLGCCLLSLVAEVADPAATRAVHTRMGFENGPELRQGLPRLIAAIETPSGVRILT